MIDRELGIAMTAAVSLCAGFIRGFTGFGGPAFMLAILALFYAPITILGKILVVDLASSTYLFAKVSQQINWKHTSALAIPTMASMPFGQWLLLNTDPNDMRRIIAAIILVTCLLMLAGIRYKHPLKVPTLIGLGIVSGFVFGATYIALVVVAAVLLGPYDKNAARTLIISWAFLVAAWYAVISVYSGTTTWADVYIAAPGAVLYFAGVWLGSLLFSRSREDDYRRVALITLSVLAILGFLT